jgi:hypothetical protein
MTKGKNISDPPGFLRVRLPEWQVVNKQILSEFSRHHSHPDRQSHFFHGRFENLYLDADRIPSVGVLLDAALESAADILQQPKSSLKCGYWFNLMSPGHVTSWHTHDEDDELLSCVYYLDVPENSGDLKLRLSETVQSITPENGMFVFFSPMLEHAVGENKSGQPRLSLAINFGPVVA